MTTLTDRITGPTTYVYRDHVVTVTYDVTSINPYRATVTAPGGKPEPVAPHFLEENTRREAQHVVDQKLAGRVVSPAEDAAMDALHGEMAETDR